MKKSVTIEWLRAILVLLAGLPTMASAETIWTDFGPATTHSVPFILNGISGSLTTVNGPNTTLFTEIVAPTDLFGVPHFPGTAYDPTPPDHLVWAVLDTDRAGGTEDEVVVTYTLTFAAPILDPTLHFVISMVRERFLPVQ